MRGRLGVTLAVAAALGCGGSEPDAAPAPPPPPPVVFHDLTVRIPEGEEHRYPFSLGEPRDVRLDLDANREVGVALLGQAGCDPQRLSPAPAPARWSDVLTLHHSERLPAGGYCLVVDAPSTWQVWRTTRVTLKLAAE